LEGISGIGALTASKLLAQYRDMRQFENVRQVVAFAGLNPSTASRALLFAARATSPRLGSRRSARRCTCQR
jgi:transposase